MWFTDSLARWYWFKHWYGECQGIVEYLADLVREYSTPQDAKAVGICFVIVIALAIGLKGAELIRKPDEGETIWKKLFNKEEDE